VALRIREARAEDAVAACDVLRRSILELCAADHRNDPALLEPWLANKTPENVAAWIAGSHMLVAEEEDHLLGVAGLDGAGRVTLNYVAPEARFRGISDALLSALEEKAAQLGCRSCTLESTKTARRFYEARGYRGREGDGPYAPMVKDFPAR
jgi:GNAT superfamily N-acetyltransferase